MKNVIFIILTISFSCSNSVPNEFKAYCTAIYFSQEESASITLCEDSLIRQFEFYYLNHHTIEIPDHIEPLEIILHQGEQLTFTTEHTSQSTIITISNPSLIEAFIEEGFIIHYNRI